MATRTLIGLCSCALAVTLACGQPAGPVSPSTTASPGAGAAADGSTLKIGAPPLSSPADGFVGVIGSSQPITLVLNDVSGTFASFPVTYEFEVRNPSGAVVQSLKVAAGTSTTSTAIAISSLASDTVFTWRARATYNGAFGPWSATRTFRTALPKGVVVSLSVARAEVDQDVAVSADVLDATPSGSLAYAWSASAGTFSGSGRSVKWHVAKGSIPTPLDVVITVVVTEQHSDVDENNRPIIRETKVSGVSDSLRVHDSVAEISKMSVTFLVDYFGNSNVAPNACLVDFWDGCPGKGKELSDIQTNRANFLLLGATATVNSVTFNGDRTFADVTVACAFHDRHLPTGLEGTSSGNCMLTAVYQQNRWWLCDSSFSGTCGSCASPSMAGRRMTMEEFFMAGIRKNDE